LFIRLEQLQIWASGKRLSKPAIIGWMICLAGLALWFYGYMTAGGPPFFDWKAHTPPWISEFLPTVTAEIGMALMLLGSCLTYWPKRPEH
jgi:hypothetical protein